MTSSAPRRSFVTAPSPDLVIDARQAVAGVTPFTDVAGVPLAIRHLRQAVRDGMARVVVVVADETAEAQAGRALARRPVPGLDVSVTVGTPPVGVALVSALTVVGGGVSMAIRGPDDVAAAERMLFAALRKTVELDGFIAYHLLRPLARPVTRALLVTSVTPNQVSLFALLLGVVAAAAAARGAFAVAGFLYWAGSVVDCVDGEIARLRVEGSRTGEWLDSVADEISTFALVAGVGWGLGAPWTILAVLCLLTGGPAVAKLYLDLHRLRLPIDTARYPWFFLRPSVHGLGARPGTFARLVYLGSFFFKRDAYTTIVSFGLVVGYPRVAFLLLLGGIAVITVLLLIHLTLGLSRPP
jgi:phosphatidylglycerophosphate synthase